jgi:hypothetical protein
MPPYRIEWLDDAKIDVRALDRPTAMRIFVGVLHFARSGSGDVGISTTKVHRGDLEFFDRKRWPGDGRGRERKTAIGTGSEATCEGRRCR